MKLTKDFRTILLRSPEMFIGAKWDRPGFHKLIYLVLSTALKPEASNDCTDIKVTVMQKSIIINDNGRGLSVVPISIGRHNGPAIEHILTVVIEVHNLNVEYYREFGFLDYLGHILNNLAEELVVETIQNGVRYRVVGSRGQIAEPLHKSGESQEPGTSLKFTWDSELFADLSFDADQLIEDMRALKREYPMVKMILEDERTGLEIAIDPA